MQTLTGKVAVVTGASKGIGAGIAAALGAAGAKVVVNYASSQAGADRVVAAIVAEGGLAVAVQADVARRPTCGASSPRPGAHSAGSTFS